ncbi:GNAT family N-acetyltransferase [Bacillus sp. PS06]|nr:GNAT family N-acetyltransferase [Bacillus sp. PS06]
MKRAEGEASLSSCKTLNPVHLLIACLDEKSGVFAEISLKTQLNKSDLRNLAENINESSIDFSEIEYVNIAVTEEVVKIFREAITYMERYKQIYVNEGHLLKALVKSRSLNGYLSEEDKLLLLTLGTTSRDMITHLGNYTFPNINTNLVRRANSEDTRSLIEYVKNNFSTEWSQTISDGFLLNKSSIYLACDANDNIIGFAAFDIYKNKKCYFGPMGVSKSNRMKGIGYALLHHCLRDMSEIGYEYAIIGGAGPIEFYEKACNAVVIPSI